MIDFIKEFTTILAQMAPYLLLGFFFAGLLYAFIPQDKIQKYFGGGSPFKSSALAALFGVPLPLCSCGVIPTGMAFYKNGASKSATTSFLISTPQTGVDSILASFSLLGLPFAIIRPIAALVTGVFGGVVTSLTDVDDDNIKIEASIVDNDKSFSDRLKLVFKYGFVDFIQDVSKWLIIGLALAALISAIVPDDFFELMNLAPIFQMLLILVVSIPMYVCATGTIPLAAVLILKGLSPGAAFVMLMAGPATNVATITMIHKVMGKKSLYAYLGSIIMGALACGLVIDYVLPIEWFTMIKEGHNHHGMHLKWWEIGSGILLVILMINAFFRTQNSTPNVEQENIGIKMSTTVIKVDGMMCNHCKSNVEKNVCKMDNVESATVNLADKSVTIEGKNIDMDAVKEKITSIGYEVM